MTARPATAQRFGTRDGVVVDIGGRHAFLSPEMDAVRLRLLAGESPDEIWTSRPELSYDAIGQLAALIRDPRPDRHRYLLTGLATARWPRLAARWMWWATVVATVFVGGTLWAVHTDRISLLDVSRTTLPVLDDRRWMLLWAAGLVASVFLHELGHLAAARLQGARAKGMRFKLAGFLPSLATNVTDVWTLPRNGRVLVSLSGPLVSLAIFASLAVFGAAGSLGHDPRAVVSALAMMNYLMGVVSLLPGFRLDGYFALSHLLDVPNLGRRSWEAFTAVLSRRGPFEPKLLVAGLAIVAVTGRILLYLVALAVFAVQERDLGTGLVLAAILTAVFGRPLARLAPCLVRGRRSAPKHAA